MMRYLKRLALMGASIAVAAHASAAIDYQQAMRSFVIDISIWAKKQKSGFLIVPQNAQELFTTDGGTASPVETNYLAHIDGTGREGLLFGENTFNVPTPLADREYYTALCRIASTRGKKVLVADYCKTRSYVDFSDSHNHALGFASFASDNVDLTDIPAYPRPLNYQNQADILKIGQVENFLYLIDPGNYTYKTIFLNALKATDYDLILVDLFFAGNKALTPIDVAPLKTKAHGGRRLVLAYMSIGEAEDYRYYWQSTWKATPPDFLGPQDPDWPGNYAVRYWLPDWQSIIFGNSKSYLQKIIYAGFDGVYLDKVDEFQTWGG